MPYLKTSIGADLDVPIGVSDDFLRQKLPTTIQEIRITKYLFPIRT